MSPIVSTETADPVIGADSVATRAFWSLAGSPSRACCPPCVWAAIGRRFGCAAGWGRVPRAMTPTCAASTDNARMNASRPAAFVINPTPSAAIAARVRGLAAMPVSPHGPQLIESARSPRPRRSYAS